MTNYLTDLTFAASNAEKIESVVLVGQKSVIYYIQMVVVALLSVDLVESVDLIVRRSFAKV